MESLLELGPAGSLILFLAGLALAIFETLTPGIILGILGFVCMVAGVWIGAHEHWALAAGEVVTALVVVPAAFLIALRRMALKQAISASGVPSVQEDLVGRTGVVITDLKPSGYASFGNRREIVHSETGMVERGKQVKVVRVEGRRIIVRPG